jgi:glycosyltransferase involved in cell wall biosynthesis
MNYWNQEIVPHLGKNGVEYVGEVNDQQKNVLLGSAAALVVPIEWEEPFGIVFAEALACGTPVICSPRGALPEFIENGIHGFHIHSVEEGIQAIAKLSTISRHACREHAEQRLSVHIATDRYLKLYDQCLQSTHPKFQDLTLRDRGYRGTENHLLH